MAEKAIKKDSIIKGVNKTMLLFKWSIYQTRERTNQFNIHPFFSSIFMKLDLFTIYDEFEINFLFLFSPMDVKVLFLVLIKKSFKTYQKCSKL